MGLRDYLIHKLGGYTKQTHVLKTGPSVAPQSRKKQELAPEITSGCWVIWEEKPAIAHPGPDGLLELHVVDKDNGSTLLISHQRPESVRRARIPEIPECRRQVPLQTLIDLGYKE